MSSYLKQFSSHQEYEQYINGSGAILPNVSICTTEGDVHYNPYVEPIETRVVAKYNVTSTSSPTPIGYNQFTSGFSSIEIDGVTQPSVESTYTFNTIGEHTVKYTLTDPTSIGYSAFNNCDSLTSITIPDSVTSIGGDAFYFCTSLTSIEIPSGVTSIGCDAFSGCYSFTRFNSDIDGVINIPSGVTSIAYNAFSWCRNITNINVNNNNTVYDSRNNCNAIIETNTNMLITGCKNTIIPDSVTSIGQYAFCGCSGLTSIVIPSGVTSIGGNAFYQCSGLTSITSNAMTAPTITKYTFQNVKRNGTLYVPIGSSGYNTWMYYQEFYLGKSGWTKVEQ